MEERKQFTFYLSIFKALRKIKKKPDRADAYDAICAYALFGEEPDLEKLPDSVSIAFELIRPVLDASRRKAKNGKQGGSKCKQTESKPEANASKPEANDTEMDDPASEGEKEKEKEKEKEIEIEHECVKGSPSESKPTAPGSAFTSFFDKYPNKINREDAWNAWKNLNPDSVTVLAIMDGLEAWRRSDRWTEDGGRYIPSAAKWLRDRRWELTPPAGKQKVPMGASGNLGEAELEAIQRVLREVDDHAVGTPGNRLD